MEKAKKNLSAASPDGVYGLAWDSRGYLEILDLATGDMLLWLDDNVPHQIKRAAFSRDMRRIYLFNCDGSLGVYYMPPVSTRPGSLSRDIVTYIWDNNWGYVDLFRLFRFRERVPG